MMLRQTCAMSLRFFAKVPTVKTESAEMSASKVQIYVYDLTQGMAAALSPMLLGQRIDGVWHTAVVIDGQEEIFFGYGINRARAGTTMFGKPHHIIDVGTTEVPKDMRDELLSDIAPRYRPEDYSLLWHNCNHFSNEYAQLLTGEGLPDYILSQAQVVFSTPWGESLMPMIMQMEGFTGRATAHGLAQGVHASAHSAVAALPQAGPSSSAAIGTRPAATVGSSSSATATAAAAVVEPGSQEAAAARSAAANAAMERAAQSAAAAVPSTVCAGDDGSYNSGHISTPPVGMASSPVAAATATDHAIEAVLTAGEDAAQKVTTGVAGLKLTADSRVHPDPDAAT